MAYMSAAASVWWRVVVSKKFTKLRADCGGAVLRRPPQLHSEGRVAVIMFSQFALAVMVTSAVHLVRYRL